MKLSTKYLLNIILSVFFFPIVFLGVNFIYFFTLNYMIDDRSVTHYLPSQIESQLKRDVAILKGKTNQKIFSYFNRIERYKDSEMIWMNREGKVIYSTSPRYPEGKTDLTVSGALKMLHDDEKKYLVLQAYLEGKDDYGYVILETPKSLVGTKWEVLRDKYTYLWYIVLFSMIGFFILNSWLFFAKLRKRLIELQKYMKKQDHDGIPKTIEIKQHDELGEVELSYNQMVEELRISRKKERKEAEIRRNLIADLSHDLRTPLTIIRGHTFSIHNERLGEKGKHSLQVINDKIDFMDHLIDNLSSYALLTAGKLPLTKKRNDILKIIRSSLSAWYPIFEKEQFTIDIDLDEPIIWDVDEIWLKRILDNLFQNILRHAHSGKYVAVQTKILDGYPVLIVKDKGPGFKSMSEKKGVGIGLSIIEMMLKQMDLQSEVKSRSNGSLFIISKVRNH
ncbi:HAMP domain-containing histidine kinase [Bacillus sp. WMMC1349]|uniref:sensor histidine kinase n=1 Tax=Bacillus sp. WMMC1349 TaxID=2736254 RepID=UPI001554B860|nr:HAMP domain-containing sensor histidine kinase [Bacillus sp. WMMC1349]NPC93522.1 HAMP domain-containing histidine kinase [Bacillus sp. WMMC1349]